MPALGALYQVNAPFRVERDQTSERLAQFALVHIAEMGRKLVDRQRVLRREQRGLHRTVEGFGLAHALARTRRRRKGPKMSSCASSARPVRASSNAATKLLAMADLRSLASAPGGRNSRNSTQSRL